MSFGKMTSFIEIYKTISNKDKEGFSNKESLLLYKTRAYKENRSGNQAWKNRASFSTATVLFRFRKPKKIEITTQHEIVCKHERFVVLSVENIREKDMYLEVLAESISGSKG